jgi:hypothetical protein
VEVLFPLVFRIKEVLFKILWEELLVQDPALTINVLCANSHYSFSIPGVFQVVMSEVVDMTLQGAYSSLEGEGYKLH